MLRFFARSANGLHEIQKKSQRAIRPDKYIYRMWGSTQVARSMLQIFKLGAVICPSKVATEEVLRRILSHCPIYCPQTYRGVQRIPNWQDVDQLAWMTMCAAEA
mmetsp:Transcript_1965/g.3465  ORF Transcript_1965/g.3465 Transcript_1965/m.3465 type:complete len:104 (+) Transcript_1965:704-1015(+)